MFFVVSAVFLRRPDVLWILRCADQQPGYGDLGFVMLASRGQPVRAFGNEETPDGDQQCGDQRGGEHPAPRAEFGDLVQNQAADAGAGKSANGLKGEGAQNEFTACQTGDALRDDHMSGRVVAAERHAEPEEAYGKGEEILAQDQHASEMHRR